MKVRWQKLARIRRSITLLSATLIGIVSTIMLICAAALLIRFGGDDDGTWGAADVADALKEAVARDAGGKLLVKQTARLDKIIQDFPTFWYVVSDKSGEVSYGPIPKWRPHKNPSTQDGTSFLAYAIDGETRNLKRMTAVRNTPVGEVWIETGGVAYTSTQLMLGTLTDATIVALPIILVLLATVVAALVFMPALIARPVRAVARAAELIDGVPDGRRLPEQDAPAELLPLVTAFNRALSRIDHAAEAQRNFLSNAAHELRTPLTNARTMLETIQDPGLRARLVAENQKLSSIVTMLLQLARISMEPIEPTEIDLVALARRVTAEHVPMALKAELEIGFVAPETPVWIQGSEPAIAVALSNLIRNAVTHAGSGGPILVDVNPAAQLSVIDSGPGLDSDQPERLLQPFERGHARGDGMGLGLSIVSQVMATHQGRVELRETPGGGTTVELSFARAAAQPSSASVTGEAALPLRRRAVVKA
ncbi:Two component sensor kinase [Bradyrhizobium sp. ORS 285]|uniref:sensor histidine kinase n=1 Tax=Bradyrhizobium sp. ORS 285 TaxID=115808 RepID=UPI0002406173|nr:HAMP domain-containing sensor histidine kinase [Bradyrhizobium sp. ORS 285]CCD84847.1 Two component sensor kinase [Bradyrhizobium sp. ORS 285]SMX55651.1 Two component sensor kinase [Bradyrhizobium sp. ORS 285]